MATDFPRESVELGDFQSKHLAFENRRVQGPGNLVDVDPDPPKLALDADESDRVGRRQLGPTMEPASDQSDRPLGARQARMGCGSLQHGQVVDAQPQGQLAA